jgi:hypothetical protein
MKRQLVARQLLGFVVAISVIQSLLGQSLRDGLFIEQFHKGYRRQKELLMLSSQLDLMLSSQLEHALLRMSILQPCKNVENPNILVF